MDSINALFDAFGGPAALGRAIDVNPSTASEMKRRQSIPVEHWELLVTSAKTLRIKGVTYEALAKMHPQRTAEKSEARAAS